MVGGLRVIHVKQGHEREFEQLFMELHGEVLRNEPGCIVHSLLRSRLHPGSYVVHEEYRDQEAISRHQVSPHATRCFPLMRPLVDQLSVEYFDILAG
ncbi:MAG: putative quinol monooxygenase [Nevskia sp.]|nr:putative quinol monooxygenase [Nevskia sp.]